MVGNGFAEITQDHVTILTDMAHTDDQIDERAAELAVQRAREAMSDPSNGSEQRDELEAIDGRDRV